MSDDPLTMRSFLQQSAAREKLVMLGIVDPFPLKETIDAYKQWVQDGKHADMAFMEQHDEARRDPNFLLDRVQSAVVFGLPYVDKSLTVQGRPSPQVAKYARLRDYHKLLRKSLDRMGASLQEAVGLPLLRFRSLVDTAPLFERALAARTAKGFIGKNSCYIHPEAGSFFLLGVLLLDQPVAFDKKLPVQPDIRTELGGCGTCRRCQVHCPTDALSEEYTVDARRCLSYWTIEHRGLIPQEFWPWLRIYWYGCDICQDVCPYNRGALKATKSIPSEYVKPGLDQLDLFEVATMSQASYEAWFGGTAMTRAKKAGLQRNALIALFELKDPRVPEALTHLGQDPDTAKDQGLYQTMVIIRSSLAGKY